jgi:hypothetical protein
MAALSQPSDQLRKTAQKRQTKKIPGKAEDFFIGNSDD